MARPSKQDTERRTYHLGVRLTPAERRRVEQAAAAAGVGLAEYVRMQALGRALVIHPPRSLEPAVFSRLRELGVSLNQVTRTANANHRLAPELPKLAAVIERFLTDKVGYGEGLDAACVAQLRRLAVNAAQLARIAHKRGTSVPDAVASLRKTLERLLTEADAHGA